jgi:hypothetical protein
MNELKELCLALRVQINRLHNKVLEVDLRERLTELQQIQKEIERKVNQIIDEKNI